MDITTYYTIFAAVLLCASVPIVIYMAIKTEQEDDRRRAEELQYEYDPKNWDTLNK